MNYKLITDRKKILAGKNQDMIKNGKEKGAMLAKRHNNNIIMISRDSEMTI